MKHSMIEKLAVRVLLLGAAAGARGGDVGAPLLLQDLEKRIGIELYAERFNRDIERTHRWGAASVEQEEDRFVARLTVLPCPRSSLHIDAGIIEAKHADGSAPLFGAGLKVQLYESEQVRLGAFASVAYANDLEYREDTYFALRGAGAEGAPDTPDDYIMPVPVTSVSHKASYLEAGGGVIVSRPIRLDPKVALLPYGGFMVSVLDGEMDMEWTQFDGEKQTETVDWREDGMLVFFAGCALTLNDRFALRLEGRFVGQASFSAGLACFF